MKKPTNIDVSVSNAYVDFIKSVMLHSESLKSFVDEENSNPDELFEGAFKSALTLYLNNNDTTIRLEFNPCLVTNKNVEESTNAVAYLIRSVTYALNNSSVEQFKRALGVFEEKTSHELEACDEFTRLVRLGKLYKTLACDFELKQELKDEFSSFLQKVIF